MDTSINRQMADRLREAGIPVTLQRVEIARVMLSKPAHMSADQVFSAVREHVPETSRATVYNTLKLFREKKLVRELIVDRERVVYDSNTAPHYHLYNEDSGQLTDVAAEELQVVGMPELPSGLTLEEVDVIIRVRTAAS
ncbi:Fur family transcriptional regulator [Denitromonas halophila]|uniref:Ferric uptake regulation protein n=1 Tax=Denitromonas halophila TaxID=1629404 RepID=A0A557QW37_9RHOO|nr:Fur family transcriptional regulator [Denitromonas halophila]TVO57132.1 transcriptional repressor [Denitromonas halophila]